MLLPFDDAECLSLSAATIYKQLQKEFPVALRSCTSVQLSQLLVAVRNHSSSHKTGECLSGEEGEVG